MNSYCHTVLHRDFILSKYSNYFQCRSQLRCGNNTVLQGGGGRREGKGGGVRSDSTQVHVKFCYCKTNCLKMVLSRLKNRFQVSERGKVFSKRKKTA